MHSIKTRFSLVLCALCLCGTNAMAAPSVRVLGANNAGIKPVAVKTGNLNQNTNAAKKASVKASGITTGQKSLTNSSNAVRIGKVNTASNVNAASNSASRLPIIVAKPKIAGSIDAGGTTNAKLNEFGERLDAFELGLDGKANITDLDNFYTKQEIDEFKEDYYTSEEIDEMKDGYYTAEEVDEKISGLNNLVLENGESVAGMADRITKNESDIAAINTAMNSVGVQITALSEGVDTNNTNIASIQEQLADIEGRIEDINTISSVTEVRRLKERVHGYQVQLEEVLEASQMIYDAETGTYRMVRVINDFEPSILTQASNLND